MREKRFTIQNQSCCLFHHHLALMTTNTLTYKQPSNIVNYLDLSAVINSFPKIYEDAYSTSLVMAFGIIDRKNDKQTERERGINEKWFFDRWVTDYSGYIWLKVYYSKLYPKMQNTSLDVSDFCCGFVLL